MGFLMAFLAGAAVGAVAALLTTTKTGPEMRATIRSWAKGFGDGDTERHAADLERERARSMGGSYDRPAGT
jgi:gas vesicle protein